MLSQRKTALGLHKINANKKLILKIFSAYYFLKLNLQHFSKIKNQKDVTKR
jgi:hypothetical protein